MKIKFPENLTPGLRPLPPGAPFTHPCVLAATWFGAGRLKPASGTWGSLAAIPPGYFIACYMGISGLALAALLITIIGTIAAQFYGKKSGVSDDQAIVIDEVAGMWIAALPAESHLGLWLIAFILFRIFDIYKPWPASFFDRRSRGGFDVMMDDVVAGLYAMLGVAAAATPFLLQR